MSRIQINGVNLNVFPIQGPSVPDEGPLGVPLTLDFTGSVDTYLLNLQNYQALNRLSQVQTIWVDNSANTAEIIIFHQLTMQYIKRGAGWQGFIPVLWPNPVSVSFQSTPGAGTVYVTLLNSPYIGSGDIFDNSVIVKETGSGGLIIPDLVPNYSFSDSTDDTVLLLSPTKGYYVGGFAVYLTSDAALTSGTDLQVALVDSVSGVIGQVNLSPANGLLSATLGQFWNNKTAASTLTLEFSTSLSAGEAFYTVAYGICNFVG